MIPEHLFKKFSPCSLGERESSRPASPHFGDSFDEYLALLKALASMII